MLRTIEHSTTHVIQKVTSPKGASLGYQVFPKEAIGDASKGQRFDRLSLARQAAHIVYEFKVPNALR